MVLAASASMFGVYWSVLHAPLPYPDQEEPSWGAWRTTTGNLTGGRGAAFRRRMEG